MKRLQTLKRVIGVAAAASAFVFLFAGKAWEDKPYTEWSREDASKVVVDSPWGQQQVFRELVSTQGLRHPSAQDYPSEGSRGAPPPRSTGEQVHSRTTAVFTVSFVSARPVRMALARLALLNQALDEERAREFIEQEPFPDQVAISVAAPGDQRDSILMQLSTADLQDSTYLELKRSKKKIYLARYVKPGEAGNDQAIFVFPRKEAGRDLVTLEEDEVKFVCRLDAEMTLERKFKLKKMVFDGKLEI